MLHLWENKRLFCLFLEGFIYNINVNYDTKEAFLLIFLSHQAEDNLHLWLKRRLHQKYAPSLIIKQETIKFMTLLENCKTWKKNWHWGKGKSLTLFWLPCQFALGVICALWLTLNTSIEAARNPERQRAACCSLYEKKKV